MSSSDLVLRREMQDPATAGALLRKMISSKDAEGRKQVMDLVKAEPTVALAALQYGDDALGLTPRGSADVADEIIGVIGDDKRAREHVEQNLTSERVSELLVGRGDLPSALVHIASIPQLIEAIRQDIAPHEDRSEASILAAQMPPSESVVVDTDRISTPASAPTVDEEDDEDSEDALATDAAERGSGDEYEEEEEEVEEPVGDAALIDDPYLRPGALLIFRSWAIRLRDRKDFTDILSHRVFHTRTFRTYVLLCFWFESGKPEELDDVPGDMFDSISMDPEEGRDELQRILHGGELSEIDLDPSEWLTAKADHGARKDAAVHAPKTIDEIERAKAKEAAGKLNF
jgi:hypothetical protein